MSFHSLIYFCLVNVVFSATISRKDRIIGGENTDIRYFPYQVSIRLQDENTLYCSGSIITEKLVVTAAHCLHEAKDHFKNTLIYTGSSSSTNVTGPSYKIKFVYFHPDFTGEKTSASMYHNDIAIIEILGCIKFDEFTKIVKLPTNNIRVGDTGILSGWGYTSFPFGTSSETLQKSYMTIISSSDCQKKNHLRIHDGQFCAYHDYGSGICVYDSGGPLTQNGVLIGIVSCGIPCALGFPDVYTNVYYYLEFIISILRR